MSSGSLTRESAPAWPSAPARGADDPDDGAASAHRPGRAPFRADIEGLRGLAVLLVVAFHAGVPWATGGFVGVDVFFVLSGFLITGLLVDELRHTGTVSLTGFYARRVRRLLPHGTLVLIASGLAAYLLLPPLDHPQVAGDISAAALFWANWHFAAAATDYLTATDQSIVLHYWSLSVEEQFYLAWPLVLLAVTRGGVAGRSWPVAMRRLAWTLGAIGLLSFAMSVLLTERSGPFGYFGVHTRAWELAAGGAIALARPVLGSAPRWSAAFAGWAGVTLVVYAATRLHEGTVFPGSAAAVPVSGAALLIIAGARLPHAGVSGLLSTRPMTWLGRHSYGFYLWHWPCLILVREHYEGTDSGDAGVVPAWAVTAAVATSLALAVTGARIVEMPVRRSRRLARGRGRSLALGGALTASAVLTGSLVLDPGPTSGATAATIPSPGAPGHTPASRGPVPGDGMPSGAAPPVQRAHVLPSVPPAEARLDVPDGDGCALNRDEVDLPADGCILGDRDAGRSIALVGDSHARQWLPAFDRVARQLGWTLFFTSKNSCPAIDVRVAWPAGGSYDNCARWRSGVMERLEALPGLQAVFVGRFAGYARLVVLPDGSRSEPENVTDAWRAGTSRSLDHLTAIAPRVVLLRDSPWPGKDVPACLSENPRSPQSCDFELPDGLRDDVLLLAEKAAARGRPAVSFLDFTDSICPGDPCRVVGDDGTIKYRDHEHLTGTFASQLSDDVQRAIAPALE